MRVCLGALLLLLGLAAAGCSGAPPATPAAATADGATPVAALAPDADRADADLLRRSSGGTPFSPTSATCDVTFHTLAVQLPPQRVEGCLKALWSALPPTRQAFCSDSQHGIGNKPDEIRVLQSTDPLDILRYCNTSSLRYGLTNEEVVQRVALWKRQHPFRLQGAGKDYVVALLDPGVTMSPQWAAEVARFCPDAVNLGAGSIDNLLQVTNVRRTLYLWWLPPLGS